MVYKDYKGTTKVSDSNGETIYIFVDKVNVFASTTSCSMRYTPDQADEVAAAFKAHARAARKAKVKAGGK